MGAELAELVLEMLEGQLGKLARAWR